MQLRHFSCARCNLSGTLPAWGDTQCRTSDGLQFFDVSDNALSGPVPNSFDAFGAMQVFNISKNQLFGDFFNRTICYGLTQLQELRLSRNAFTNIPTGEHDLFPTYLSALISAYTYGIAASLEHASCIGLQWFIYKVALCS